MSNTEKTIPVVTSKTQANFPFCVQTQPTENWGTVETAVTLDAAMEAARALAAKYPALPVRIEHCQGGPKVVDMLPVFKHREGSERPYRHALWTGKGEPPALGARVTITINAIGPGTVTGYAVEGGYLGVMVRADEATRPAWHKQNNPENRPGLAFGPELKAD
jgi:hypothetical protein